MISSKFNELNESETVDVCFLVECSTHLNSVIDDIQNAAEKLVGKLRKRFRCLNMRFAFVGYCNVSETITFQFTQDINAFNSFINVIKLKDEENRCKDVFGGLEEVTKLSWSQNTRILFHIAASPCYGSRFHYGLTDPYPNGDQRLIDITNLLEKITELKLNYNFIELNGSTIKMIDEFNSDIIQLKGNMIELLNYIPNEGFQTKIANATVKSILRERKLVCFNNIEKNLIKSQIIKPISWYEGDSNKFDEAKLYIGKRPKKMNDIRSKVKFESEPVGFMISKNPFHKSSTYYVYTASIFDVSGYKQKFIAKEFVFNDSAYNSIELYKDIVEKQEIAAFLAYIFLDLLDMDMPLRFLDMRLIEINGKYYLLEEYIDDCFIEWTNAAGLAYEDKMFSYLHAFAHWTYKVTDGYLIVTDLIGYLKNKSVYYLTEPTIACHEDILRFGNTNFGKLAIDWFFEKQHHCNLTCERFELIKYKKDVINE